ncbi:MAG: hypothetical protein LUG16_04540 [Candidatus Gastranaerophilales bacterium]|nr:hypothetical protein [Candidatus Gastranaerophilales bacterium]
MYDCGETRLNSLCVPMDGANSEDEGNSDNYKTYNGKTMDYNLFDDGQFVLSDGSLLLFEGNQNTVYRVVSVDVNGYSKKPNRLGKDLFMFQLMETGELLPMGANGTLLTSVSKYCSDTSSHGWNGAACTYLILNK